MKNAVVVVAFLVVVGLGIEALANATMTRPTPVDSESRLEVIVAAQVKREGRMRLKEIVHAILVACRVQVDRRLTDEGYDQLGENTFRIIIRPALNESDRRQFHGCVEDARIQHLQADVLTMRRL